MKGSSGEGGPGGHSSWRSQGDHVFFFLFCVHHVHVSITFFLCNSFHLQKAKPKLLRLQKVKPKLLRLQKVKPKLLHSVPSPILLRCSGLQLPVTLDLPHSPLSARGPFVFFCQYDWGIFDAVNMLARLFCLCGVELWSACEDTSGIRFCVLRSELSSTDCRWVRVMYFVFGDAALVCQFQVWKVSMV